MDNVSISADANLAQPVVTDALNNIIVLSDAEDVTTDLSGHFDDPFTTGLVARFELFDSSLGSGVKEVLLFDQPGSGAPLTVQNFLNYVNDGDYINTIIHRSIPGFIVQGGGFTVNDLANNLSNPANAVGVTPTDPPVQNEFSPDRSNLRGTIAMAKLPSDPNSATSQWFFNLADNSEDLDNQNGGFTVFGEVLSVSDLATLDAIESVNIFNGTGLNPAFSDLPLIFNDPNNPIVTGDENFVRYSSITVAQRDELEFTVSNNSNPQLVNVSISENQLVLDYLPGQVGTANITIQATNLLGQVIEDTFSVTVSDSDLVGTAEDDEIIGSAANDTLLGGGGQDTLSGRQGDDTLLGNQGNDILLAGQGDDILGGGQGNDTLNGGNGDDDLQGKADSDTLFGGQGDDTLDGGTGDDSLFGQFDNDLLVGGEGNDILGGGQGNDQLFGSIGRDQLRGGQGDDSLSGGRGVDILEGADGNDILVGGLRGDTLTGGAGSDTFRYITFDQSLLIDGATETFDIIADLVIGTDIIDGINAVSASNVVQAGDAATLNEAGIQSILSAASFAANGAATFTSNSRSFLTLNDSVAGYQQGSDAVIEITGFSGDLANLAIT